MTRITLEATYLHNALASLSSAVEALATPDAAQEYSRRYGVAPLTALRNTVSALGITVQRTRKDTARSMAECVYWAQRLGGEAFWGQRPGLYHFLTYQEGCWREGTFVPAEGLTIEQATALVERLIREDDGMRFSLMALDAPASARLAI